MTQPNNLQNNKIDLNLKRDIDVKIIILLAAFVILIITITSSVDTTPKWDTKVFDNMGVGENVPAPVGEQ